MKRSAQSRVPVDPADRAIDFIERLTLPDGKPFLLEDWQREIVRSFFGTLKSDGTRQYRKLLLMIARKNGKTTLIAALALYFLFADGAGPTARVYTAAKKREQSAQVYETAKAMALASPTLSKVVGYADSQKRLRVEKGRLKGAELQSLAADAGGELGKNPSAVIFDECLAARGASLVNNEC